MAFVKRTWLARIGTGLNKFIIGEKDANNKQTLTNSPDTVSQEGDVISADNLNDLEDRIDDAFTADATAIASKADKTYVDTQLEGKQDTLTFDSAPTSGSNNPVKSGGVYSALLGKVSPSDLVIQSVRWSGEWFNPYADGATMAFNFDVEKTGYTPIGIVGYSVDLYKSGGAHIKFSVEMVDLDQSHLVANVRVIFLESATVSASYSGATIDVLYVKN